LIYKKADFDRTMTDSIAALTMTEEKLEAALLKDNLAHVILAEQHGTAVGMALYYFRFSSFAGQPSLWLEDLFLEQEFRGQGVGRKLMEQLATVAVTRHCTHMGWTASTRNERGLAFYHTLGAQTVLQKQWDYLYDEMDPRSRVGLECRRVYMLMRSNRVLYSCRCKTIHIDIAKSKRNMIYICSILPKLLYR
jgi:GNAT superfamily N-acetyltransferase